MVIIRDTSVKCGGIPNCLAVVPNVDMPCLIMSRFVVEGFHFEQATVYALNNTHFQLEYVLMIFDCWFEQIHHWRWAVITGKTSEYTSWCLIFLITHHTFFIMMKSEARISTLSEGYRCSAVRHSIQYSNSHCKHELMSSASQVLFSSTE